MPVIRLNLPNAWRAVEAKATAKGAAALLTHNASQGIKTEGGTILRGELRAFAQRSLVGRPANTFLSDVENNQMRDLVVRIVRQTTRDAAAAGKPQPPVGPLMRVLAVVNRREQSGLAGAYAYSDGPPVGIQVL